MDNPIGLGARPDHFLNYRLCRTVAEINIETLTIELSYKSAVLDELQRTQKITCKTPITSVRSFANNFLMNDVDVFLVFVLSKVRVNLCED